MNTIPNIDISQCIFTESKAETISRHQINFSLSQYLLKCFLMVRIDENTKTVSSFGFMLKFKHNFKTVLMDSIQ